MPQLQSPTTWFGLNGANEPSLSGISDIRTGQPVFAGGLLPGAWFDLTEQEANALSWTDIGTLHTGRYRWVQVDPAANVALIGTGYLGVMSFLPSPPDVNMITTSDKMPAAQSILRPVAFLNVITPGNYGWIQESGVASGLAGSAIAAGAPVAIAIATGMLSSGASPSQIGVAITSATAGSLALFILGSPFGPVQG